MRVLYISLLVVVLDQITKIIVKGFSIPFLNIKHEGMYHGQRIPMIGDFFQFTFVENPGMAFGIDLGDGFKLWISLFSIVASIGLVYYLFTVRNQSKSLRISLALILGGAFGNLIDRVFYGVFYGYAPLFYGKVVDFFDFDFFDFEIFNRSYDRWPIFNIADLAVSVGVIILLIFYNKHQKETESVIASSTEIAIDAVNAETTELVVDNKIETPDEIEVENEIKNEQSHNREEA
ncbi:MAG TPA: signal peptidase II [Ignavibacteriaceae bacterium]|jgi:signal peptidase II|nr:signal peptidase II [Ignavibacteriaceae bacterium]